MILAFYTELLSSTASLNLCHLFCYWSSSHSRKISWMWKTEKYPLPINSRGEVSNRHSVRSYTMQTIKETCLPFQMMYNTLVYHFYLSKHTHSYTTGYFFFQSKMILFNNNRKVAIWSESSLCAHWVAKVPMLLHAGSEDWSDWADAQTDQSLRWVQSHIVGFVMKRLKLLFSGILVLTFQDIDTFALHIEETPLVQRIFRKIIFVLNHENISEPHHEKTCLRGKIQTSLLSYRD